MHTSLVASRPPPSHVLLGNEVSKLITPRHRNVLFWARSGDKYNSIIKLHCQSPGVSPTCMPEVGVTLPRSPLYGPYSTVGCFGLSRTQVALSTPSSVNTTSAMCLLAWLNHCQYQPVRPHCSWCPRTFFKRSESLARSCGAHEESLTGTSELGAAA